MEHRVKYIDLEPGADPPAGFDVVELKFDGHWAEARFDGRGVCEIYTRTGTLRKRCEVDPRLPRMALIGEYLYGTTWSTQGDRSGQFHAFDIVPKWWRAPALISRRKLMQRKLRALSDLIVARECRFIGVERQDPEWHERMPDWFHIVGQCPTTSWRNLWATRVETGEYEGLVFKKSTGLFGEPHARMKRVHTADFVCDGFNIGAGRYEGVVYSILGSLYVDGVRKLICNVPGLTDIQRTAFAANPNKFIGRVFEATGKGRFESGALRHGSFIRWRNDKRPEECTWST